jgi:hypothetical protein
MWFERSEERIRYHTASPQQSSGMAWQPCEAGDCVGEAIASHTKCFQHADDIQRSEYLASVSRGQQRLAVRGTSITQQLWEMIRAALAAASERGFPLRVALAGAEIAAILDFSRLTFEYLEINGTVVAGLRINECRFKGSFNAQFATFGAESPNFLRTEFSDRVDLSYASAGENLMVGFLGCRIHTFVATGIRAQLGIQRCEYERDFVLSEASANHVLLTDCTIGGELDLSGARLGIFRAPGLRAPNAHRVGPMAVENDCDLTYARFEERVLLEVKARELRLTGSQFSAGGRIAADSASTYLDGVTLGGPLQVSGTVDRAGDPTIVTVQGADAGAMTFAHVNMTRCIFSGAHGLSEITLEPTVKLLQSPRLTARRRCIADEFAWRATLSRLRSWRWRRSDTPQAKLRASEVAGVYRSLRRAYESRSDQPGAADFYYGEMEMRRNSLDAGFPEWAIVSAYWLLSGYALRAWRVCFWLVCLLLGGGYAMARWGFVFRTRFYTGFMHLVRSAVPGLRPTYHDAIVSQTGTWLQIAFAILTPLLLALLVLALRNRVRR